MIARRQTRQWLARWHERNLYLTAHPAAFLLAAAVAQRPIATIPGIGHVISDLALAKEVLSAPERFAKTGPGALSDALTQVLGEKALVNMDGEAHRALRTELRELFAPSSVAELVAQAFEPTLAAVRARFARDERVDIVRLARVLAARVMCALVGIELPADRADELCLDLQRRAVAFARVLSLPTRRLSRRRLARAETELAALTAGARPAFARSVAGTLPARLRALGLGFEESRGLIGLLLLAGTETTASALPRIVALLIDTGQWAALRANRQLTAAAVEEGRRLTAPVAIMTRNVVVDTLLAGRRLRAGERVVVCLANALKTPAAAVEPLCFSFERTPPAGADLSFGHGPHFCLGAALARRELETGLAALLDGGELKIVRRRYGRRAVFAGYSLLEVDRASPASVAASPPSSIKLSTERTGR